MNYTHNIFKTLSAVGRSTEQRPVKKGAQMQITSIVFEHEDRPESLELHVHHNQTGDIYTDIGIEQQMNALISELIQERVELTWSPIGTQGSYLSTFVPTDDRSLNVIKRWMTFAIERDKMQPDVARYVETNL
jgi:hypothetical protein